MYNFFPLCSWNRIRSGKICIRNTMYHNTVCRCRQVGSLVAVRIDNSWKRGRVTRITEEEETSIEVFLLDSGLTEAAVRPEDLVPLPDQFITRLPFQVERVRSGSACMHLLDDGSGMRTAIAASSLVDPDPIRIRIQEGKNDPQE